MFGRILDYLLHLLPSARTIYAFTLGCAVGMVLGMSHVALLRIRLNVPACDIDETGVVVMEPGRYTCAAIAADVRDSVWRLGPRLEKQGITDPWSRLKKVHLRIRPHRTWTLPEHVSVLGLTTPVMLGVMGYLIETGNTNEAFCHELAHAFDGEASQVYIWTTGFHVGWEDPPIGPDYLCGGFELEHGRYFLNGEL